jgi:integrase
MRGFLNKDWPIIRPFLKRGVLYHQVDPRPIEERFYFRTEEEAKAKRHELQIKYGKPKQSVTDDDKLLAETKRALEILKPTGKGLIEAATIVLNTLKGVSDQTVQELQKEYLESKDKLRIAGEISKSSYTNLKSRLTQFANHFKTCKVREINRVNLQKWFDGLPVSMRTRHNNRLIVNGFFKWCVQSELIRQNPCEFISFRFTKREEVKILTIDQCKELLKNCPEELKAFVLITLFAGVRMSEAAQLKWHEIENGQIYIRREIAKTREPRFVHCHKDLTKKLEALRKSGSIVPINLRKKIETLKDKVTGGIPNNALRHSFASYWLPIHHNREQLAEEMGNSVKIIGQNYRKAITKTEARKFWNLLKLDLDQA